MAAEGCHYLNSHIYMKGLKTTETSVVNTNISTSMFTSIRK